MEWLAACIQDLLARWGYLALSAGLLGENAGLPLPGETILMYSAFIAHKTHELNLLLVILVATAAAVVGDNVGFFAGRWLGPRLLGWLERKFNMGEDIATARDQMRCHGGATIFWARYVVGLRTVAGPVAGALNMEWRSFLLYNALGAVTWVTSVAVIAYFSASKIDSLAGYIEKVSWVVSGSIFAIGYIYWRRRKKRLQQFGPECGGRRAESRRAA
ncbi:DedA family protein [Occallatibacter riparius]|uniref:DedA family protein n=1 Tax=Occallatibacter riparius TaxID=1002689 RepID=A0A9J7BLX6_9BACT|nr:DedA family protein [Occallatibacter riparius]UWZ81902.1 DedA family protein [Occallatibacter riparius]